MCCIIACWTEALRSRCVRVGVVYAMGICFLETLAKSFGLNSESIINEAFPALLSAYYVFITPKFALISNYIFYAHRAR